MLTHMISFKVLYLYVHVCIYILTHANRTMTALWHWTYTLVYDNPGETHLPHEGHECLHACLAASQPRHCQNPSCMSWANVLKLSLRLHELRPALALSKLLHFTSRPADSFGVNIVLRNRNEGSSLSLSTTRKHSWNTSTCRSLLYMARHIHVTIRPETFEGLPRSSKPMCDELDHKHVLFRLAPPNIAM